MEKVENKASKKCAEALAGNPAWLNSKYYQKFRKEAILEGNISDETPSVDATLEILNQILMGAEKYLPLDFAKNYTTDKATFKVPIGTYGDAVAISGGAFGNSPKTVTYADVSLDNEYGVEVTWTRAHLEDATWDVMAEQNEGAGYAIKEKLVNLLVTEMEANGTAVGATDPVASWANFVEFVGKTDVAGYGMSDYVLVTPSGYWALLAIDEFVNSLYAGTDEVMRTGVAKTMMGVTVLKCNDVSQPIAVNSKKGIALVTRRAITVEPFENPDDNEYGFVASTRATVKILNASAVSVAKA